MKRRQNVKFIMHGLWVFGSSSVALMFAFDYREMIPPDIAPIIVFVLGISCIVGFFLFFILGLLPRALTWLQNELDSGEKKRDQTLKIFILED